jgi:hypothetical protein
MAGAHWSCGKCAPGIMARAHWSRSKCAPGIVARAHWSRSKCAPGIMARAHWSCGKCAPGIMARAHWSRSKCAPGIMAGAHGSRSKCAPGIMAGAHWSYRRRAIGNRTHVRGSKCRNAQSDNRKSSKNCLYGLHVAISRRSSIYAEITKAERLKGSFFSTSCGHAGQAISRYYCFRLLVGLFVTEWPGIGVMLSVSSDTNYRALP